LLEERNALQKQLERLEAKALVGIRNEILSKVQFINGVNFIGEQLEVSNADALRKICMDLKNEIANYVVILTANIGGKAAVALLIDENIANEKNWEAPKLIKEHIAGLIKGGGGGQKSFASAGGTDITQLAKAIDVVKGIL
jgi:alanyl-tRNA synthetase